MNEPSTGRRIIYRGRKIDLALQPVRLADGSTAEREIVMHRGAVALVPMVDPNHVCLLRNHRYTVDRTLIEVPAGTIDRGEAPEQTAARELTEETGYQAGRILRVRDWLVSPGVMDERMYLFLCEDLCPGASRLEADEHLQPFVVGWEDAVRMVHDGSIEDGKTIISILLCDHLRRLGGQEGGTSQPDHPPSRG